MCCGSFLNGVNVYKAIIGTSTMILATTIRFSPHTEERKLTLVQITKGEENVV